MRGGLKKKALALLNVTSVVNVCEPRTFSQAQEPLCDLQMRKDEGSRLIEGRPSERVTHVRRVSMRLSAARKR